MTTAPELDYLNLYLQNPQINHSPAALLALFLIGLVRILPIIALAPFLGAKNLNRPAKIGFGAAIVLILFPKLITASTTPMIFNHVLLMHALKEFFVGLSIGMLAAMPFWIMESSGTLIDHQRGASSLMVNDPILLNQDAPTGVLFNLVAVNIFFYIGGPFIFFDALMKSYEVLPPDMFLSDIFFLKDAPFYATVVNLLTHEMNVAVRFAAPALIVMLMTDLFLGISNRMAPQVQITFLGMPLKSLLAIAIVWMGWYFLTKQFEKEDFVWLGEIRKFVQQLPIGKGT